MNGTCVSVTVAEQDPADIAAAIAGQRGATLTGLGQANGKAQVPDIWIPDSSSWLQCVRAVGGDLVPAEAVSVAQSPVVLAMPQPIAAALGWPKTKLTWAALLQRMTTGGGMKTGIVEPGRDASGLSGLLAPPTPPKADGTVGPGSTPLPGAPPGPIQAAAATHPALIQQTLSMWAAVTQPGRILAVIDVSGSMNTPVPTAGNASREQVLLKAAGGGLNLFDDAWAVGLWIFSTKLDGNTPYKELVPIGPLVSQRNQLAAALGGIQATHGDTGLYDTVLAAYKTVQTNWDPGKINSVILMTDGQNDNPGGLTLDQLVTELQKVADPKRPGQVVA